MREILFRGKLISTGKMVYGYLLQIAEETRIYSTLDFPHGTDWFLVDPSTVEQYTGLTDKNGNRIFEGGILQCGNIKGVVKYSNKRAAFTFKWKRFTFHGGDFFKECNLADFGELSGLEVIGNIHDNKLEDFENGC